MKFVKTQVQFLLLTYINISTILIIIFGQTFVNIITIICIYLLYLCVCNILCIYIVHLC